MSKRTVSKYKIDRRQGVNLWGRPKSPFNANPKRPGQHGAMRPKTSDYGIQLMAKQRIKGFYGNISEKQFLRYYKEAVRRAGDSSENLIGLLESRLDSVVYRMKFVPTVFAARQFVNHGHVEVNGKRVNIPSYTLKAGDTVRLKQGSEQTALVIEALQSKERDVPPYVEMESPTAGRFARVPNFEEVPYAAKMEPNLVIEFYSR